MLTFAEIRTNFCKLNKMTLQMVNASALDLAKAALASGASPEQVALMMHQSGASQKEMSQVQKAVQDHMSSKGEWAML